MKKDLLLKFQYSVHETELGNFIADCVAEARRHAAVSVEEEDPGQFLSGVVYGRGYRRGVPPIW